jgi:hypothetical protein
VRTLSIEFPQVDFGLPSEARSGEVVLEGDAWRAPKCDLFAFDAKMGLFERRDGGVDLRVRTHDGIDVAFQVMTRFQRLAQRKNVASSDVVFERVLSRHKSLHATDKPLVRADFDHSIDVWQWVLRLAPTAGFAVQAAALFHDVERLASESERRVEHYAPDYQAFKDEHARRGAKLARDVLVECGVDAGAAAAVHDLVLEHERPAGAHRSEDAALLADADALSFFSLNSAGFFSYYGAEHTKKKIAYSLARMSARARACVPRLKLREEVAKLLEVSAREATAQVGS